jgi:hypothetical protein
MIVQKRGKVVRIQIESFVPDFQKVTQAEIVKEEVLRHV